MSVRYFAGLACAVALIASPTLAETFPVHIQVDASKSEGRLEPIWRFFGADEPNYATMKDGQRLLTTLGALKPRQVYFRTHNLLTTGDGTPALKWGSTNIYTEDANGNPVYSWTIVDHILDTYLARGVRPYVQAGFMPEALSSHPQPYRHEWRPGLDYAGIKSGVAYPPKDYGKWEELIYQWVRHCVDRYGQAEVETWYWETWNEPNLDFYWGGTREEFFRLHDTTVRAIRRALPNARVGGPDMAGSNPQWLNAFMDHVTQGGTPADFISFHAKGAPKFIDDANGGHVQMGLNVHLQTADQGFATIVGNSTFKSKPIVIGESDPEGCAACQGPANAYRNGTMYSSYTAASFPRLMALAKRRGAHLEGALTWAFEFEDQRYFAGFRQLASNGLNLPVANVFKMFAMMDGDQILDVSDHQAPLDAVLTSGVRGAPDVGSMASFDGHQISILVWHYHDDDLAGPDANIHIDLTGLPKAFAKGAAVTQYRVDSRHSNSFTTWKAMGEPIAPTNAQYAELQKASELVGVPLAPALIQKGATALDLDLPRQGVALIVVTPQK
ncbi:hypothetical protein AEAC466_21325 [Asticcacaulis sp. AC466]|uniref:GH39 family glycosyl hydrolase n=1 Tax=Asticcacaulis sp. AC466 TaxID=1282362 RepID=UPI0003C40E08|nr:hypothetical protein [Asticcacaulis sp. AC466]ESQ81475.1 hypothetical protein AEAC466_21325 [Asticcacaulis sp. AC466]